MVELVRLALRGKTLVPAETALQVLRSRPHGHVAAVLGMVKALDEAVSEICSTLAYEVSDQNAAPHCQTP